MREKVVGILGGMGPEATVDLMQKIITNTPAADDCDHIRCIVDNNPKIPSRIRAILTEDGEDPGPELADMAQRLENWGADFLCIPCNTAHAYYDDVVRGVSIPVVHLIDLVVAHVVKENPRLQSIGMLGSTTIVKLHLYTTSFARSGVEVVYPDEDIQQQLFEIIRRIKRGETGAAIRQNLGNVAEHLQHKGVSLAVLGCTELGVIADALPIRCLDGADILAREVVAVAKLQKSPHIRSHIGST